MGRSRRFPQHNSDYTAFRRRLKEARDSAGLSQQELADMLKRPQTWVSKNETGERRVDAVELAKLARVLRKSMEWFVEEVRILADPTPPQRSSQGQTLKMQRRSTSNT